MADDVGRDERTEDATQQRRDDFKKRGQVAQTKELGTVLFFIAAALFFWITGRFYLKNAMETFQQILGDFAPHLGRSGDLIVPLKYVGLQLVWMLTPSLLLFALIGVISQIIQVGFMSKEDALELKFEHINPLSGIKRVLSMRSVIEALKALIKIGIVGFIAWSAIKSEFIRAPLLTDSDPATLLTSISSSSLKLFMWAGLSLLVLAVLDYGYQRWDLEQEMKMTKQEIKEEVKNREGDPQIKARIRRIQREMAQKRMMDEVPKADVIVTNPTHIAVALKYGADLPAPQLIAKGADLIAEKIKQLARDKGIPIVENKPLARSIYKTMKLGQIIPKELYNTVAEVLAYVYRLKKKKKV